MHTELKQTPEWNNVSISRLQNEIIPQYKPAVLKNVIGHWKILEHAQNSEETLVKYLQQLSISDRPTPTVELFIANEEIEGRYFYGDSVDEYNFKRAHLPFREILQHFARALQSQTKESSYAGAVDIRTQLPHFEEHNSFPLLDGQFKFSPKAWMGSAAKISTHFDVQDNIACVVSGKRRFIMFPPEQIKNLYVGPLDKTVAGPPLSMVDVDNPDLEKFPRFEEAIQHAEIAELEPGDALYIPSLWWHNVKSDGDFCMLVNYWWNNPEFRLNNPMMAINHGLYSISHLPLEERKAWKSLFDYYVFQTDEPALSHLPNEQRGVLGKMTPRIYNLIKTHLLRSMGIK